jgi:predicted MFS family arabinose efflux permease
LLATLGLGGTTFGLTRWSSTASLDAIAIATIVAGLVMLAAFLWVEARRSDKAMMPLAMFADRCFAGLNLLTFLLYGAFGAAMLLIPYVLISAGGYSPVQAGMAMLPLPILLTLASPPMGQLAGRIGPRWFLIAGPLVVAGGMLLGQRIGSDTSYWTSVFPAMAVMAAGMAIAVAPLTSALLGSVAEEHVGTASGFNSAVARIGGLIATASLGVVLARTGEALIGGFHLALVGAAITAVAASAAAVFLVKQVKLKAP